MRAATNQHTWWALNIASPTKFQNHRSYTFSNGLNDMVKQPEFGKILRINLLVIVLSAILVGLLCQISADVSLFAFAIFYLGQVLVNIVIGFTKLSKGPAGYFLSALLVLIIGFGSCTGMLVYWGTNGGPPH
jgi:hypothetical protein